MKKRYLLVCSLLIIVFSGTFFIHSTVTAQEEDWETLSNEETFAVTEEDRKAAKKYFSQGKKFHMDQSYPDAINAYEKALERDPELSKARRALAWAKRDQRRKNESQEASEYSLDALVRETKGHYKRGRRYERENKPLEAAAAYKDAIRLIPGYPEAKEGLRRVQSRAQRNLAPLPYSATSASGKAPQAHMPLDMSSNTGTLKDMKIRAKASQLRRPSADEKKTITKPRAAASYKISSPRSKRRTKEQKSIRGAIRKHYLIGAQALNRGDYALAIKEFDLILEFDPQHRDAQYKLNQSKKKQALEIKTAKRKAEMAKSKGDTMGALTALRDIVNIDPNNAEAMETWERTKRENKGIINEIYRKGVKAYAKGDYQTALQAWELVLDIDPKYAKAQESINKVRDKMELIK
ncbi:hypothetical protein K8S19_03470 [bacterium]|nr:hypothetical protein [bacterium]